MTDDKKQDDTSRFVAPPPVVIPEDATPEEIEKLRFPVVPRPEQPKKS